MDSFDYFILGNSAAAVAAIEALRRRDPIGTIGLCSAERHRAYSRPLISYLIEGRVSADRMYLRPADFYRRHRVRLFLNQPAVGLDPETRQVSLRGGRSIRYGKVLLAMGGVPAIPGIPGMPRSAMTFTSWGDADRLGRLARPGIRALVLGGGLIGIKAAEALRARGAEVTVVEMAKGVLSLALDERASQIAGERLMETGVRLVCGTTIERFAPRKRGRVAVLRSGEETPYDVFVCAVGVRPNAALAEQAGVPVGRGVIVDDLLRAGVEGVYAAGDVAEAHDVILDQRRPLPIWPSASAQGRAAGANMAGADKAYAGGFGMNSVQIHDTPFISAGITGASGELESLQREDPRSGTYRRVLLRDNLIVGFIVVGAVDRAGIYTGLMRDRVDVSHFRDDLLDDRFGYISLPRQIRRERLAGVSTL
jgi:NAD(P)H-nitrite reductase large subunit